MKKWIFSCLIISLQFLNGMAYALNCPSGSFQCGDTFTWANGPYDGNASTIAEACAQAKAEAETAFDTYANYYCLNQVSPHVLGSYQQEPVIYSPTNCSCWDMYGYWYCSVSGSSEFICCQD